MKKIVILFLLITSGIILTQNNAIAADYGLGPCASGTKCYGSFTPCSGDYPTDTGIQCNFGTLTYPYAGHCCASADGGGGGGGGGSTWGNPADAIPLSDVSNALGANRPTSAKVYGWKDVVGIGISVLIFLAILLALFYLAFGGYNWITSGGDRQKLKSAREKVLYAVLGLIVAMLSYFIFNILAQMFKVPRL